ncbi:DUF742 domain-containing protein [Streptomyces pini]|uniref:DUF742 domain-containing protein n=1 Tax=Streptomyces pini TaxID=1520580 RepID=A0A1I4D430_9ACTN|nr:DUF742 domain-containing protein [Streptomyces pini]SFK86926.1 Protein of unknown function [Streptomyces pini]
MTDRWFDDAAGPVVRPYAMTRGRTRSATGSRIDPVALVVAETPAEPAEASPEALPATGPAGSAEARLPASPGGAGTAGAPGGTGVLGPEHLDIVARCRRAPQPVAELAAVLDLPVGVVRVLVGDLVEAELVRVTRPVPPAELPDERILRDVINGLRAL